MALARLLLESTPGEQCSETLLLPPPSYRHYRHCPSPDTRLRSLWTASLSSGSDQRRISGCGTGWLLAGPDSLPLWLCRVCAFVLLRCFSCSHTVLPKEHSLGVIFFSSLSSCYAVFFFNSTCISLLIILCMIVYVTNNKEPWTLSLQTSGDWGDKLLKFRNRNVVPFLSNTGF